MGQTPARLLERFVPGQGGTWLTGGLLHLGVSGVYGIGYGMLIFWLPRGWRGRLPGWLLGLAYGAALLLVAELVLLPGSGSALRQIPLAHFALAHGVYGLALGDFVARKNPPRGGIGGGYMY
jgi:hypothetical protein